MRGWDTHIHLERYGARAHELIRESAGDGIEAMVAVSMDLPSCEETLALARAYPGYVLPAFGFHPEQELPSEEELDALIDWIRQRRGLLPAIGEVGLPYYKRQEALECGTLFDAQPYVGLLERFIALAAEWDVPIVLHAVYDDAAIACDLLEEHSVRRAHFHWFKGDDNSIERMIRNGYFVSLTPDCLYEEETRSLIRKVPLALLLTETDGPWPFEGPFEGRETHPSMIASIVEQIAHEKKLSVRDAADTLIRNARKFYMP